MMQTNLLPPETNIEAGDNENISERYNKAYLR